METRRYYVKAELKEAKFEIKFYPGDFDVHLQKKVVFPGYVVRVFDNFGNPSFQFSCYCDEGEQSEVVEAVKRVFNEKITFQMKKYRQLRKKDLRTLYKEFKYRSTWKGKV